MVTAITYHKKLLCVADKAWTLRLYTPLSQILGVSTCVRGPNVTLDLEGVYLERFRAKKNEMSGLASNVTAKIKFVS